jgi:hypothetical protein
MWSWILIVALYVSNICFFRLIGGVGAAADALQRWGNSSARRRLGRSAPSS